MKPVHFHVGTNEPFLCGEPIKDGMGQRASNNFHLVDCPDCRRLYKPCSFCFRPSIDNPNHFYPSCKEHEKLAQIETERFFMQNPDYTKWNKL